jgi:hypothetical protein
MLSSDRAEYPAIVVDRAGNATAVWVEDSGWPNSRVAASRLEAATGVWSAPETIQSGSGDSNDWPPDISADSAGNVFVVWTQSDSGSAPHTIRANRYDIASRSWGAAATIQTGTELAQVPAVAADGAGNAIAVWVQRTAGVDTVHYNRYTAGSGWGLQQPLQSIDGKVSAYEGAPEIAMDPAGNAIAVWTQESVSGSRVYARRFSIAIGTWGAQTLLQTDSGRSGLASVAFDAAGNALAVWPQYDPSARNYLMTASRYRIADNSWSSPEVIQQSTRNSFGYTYRPALAVDISGNAIAVWSQQDPTSGRYVITASRYSASGGTWGSPRTIQSGTDDDAYKPSVGFDGAGNAVAMWLQEVAQAQVTACRFDGATLTWSSPIVLQTVPGGLWAWDPSLAVHVDGSAFAVWQQPDPFQNIGIAVSRLAGR